jgi:hypothetical protein
MVIKQFFWTSGSLLGNLFVWLMTLVIYERKNRIAAILKSIAWWETVMQLWLWWLLHPLQVRSQTCSRADGICLLKLSPTLQQLAQSQSTGPVSFIFWQGVYLMTDRVLTFSTFPIINNYNNSVALVCDWTIPTERPPLAGEVSANFCG